MTASKIDDNSERLKLLGDYLQYWIENEMLMREILENAVRSNNLAASSSHCDNTSSTICA